MLHSPLRTHAQLACAFESEAVQKALPQILTDSMKGKGAKDAAAFRFGLECGAPGGQTIGGALIHLDAPHAVTLAHGGRLMAYATFYFPPRGPLERATIEQIQGVKLLRVRGGMEPKEFRSLRSAFGKLEWERALIRLIIELARQLSVRRVSIAAAQTSNYLICSPDGSDTEEIEARQKRFLSRYDGTAEALGFVRADAWEYSLDL